MNRNLVICTVGDTSCHRTWLAGPEAPNFDVFLIYYGEGPVAAAGDAQYYVRRKGFKFELLDYVVNQHRETLENYDRIWCPDDDIASCTRDVNVMFEVFQRYELRLRSRRLPRETFPIAACCASPAIFFGTRHLWK